MIRKIQCGASNLELTGQAHSTRIGFAWSNLDEKEK
jgi:hypothetical protein